jgi:hypothetical protein
VERDRVEIEERDVDFKAGRTKERMHDIFESIGRYMLWLCLFDIAEEEVEDPRIVGPVFG